MEPTTIAPPEEAIRWLVRQASGNVELASLSNVCRSWRKIVFETLLEQAKESLSGSHKHPSMLLLPSMLRYLMCQERMTNNNIESYCVAWFHPDGIEFNQLPADALDDSDDEEDKIAFARDHRGDSPQNFAPSGQRLYVEEDRGASRRVTSRLPGASFAGSRPGMRRLESQGNRINCVYQWNGYTEAMEILAPFGYKPDFVRKIISRAREEAKHITIGDDVPEKSVRKNSTHPPHQTFAVRGSTYARPEGYCLCWDDDLPSFETQHTSSPMQRHEYNKLVRRRNRKRRELQRDVLPRMLYSAPNKGAEAASQVGIRQPCIQFLNSDSSHAVRMFSHPFKPSPIPTPITIFCVAIATEDGCFFSGLRQRFELGHLYPESAPENMIERSPICICTASHYVDGADGQVNSRQASGEIKQQAYNSDDSSYDMSLERAVDPGFDCGCSFTGLGNMEEEEDENETGDVYRGRRGPGQWHCYTAVVDGRSSRLRIDGVDEILRCNINAQSSGVASLDGLTIGADHTFDMSLCFGQGSEGEGEGAMAELALFKGNLDLPDIQTLEKYFMRKHGIAPPSLPEEDLSKEDEMSRLAHAMLTHAPHHKVFSRVKKRVPLKYMTKHRSVSWRQTNPVTGEAIRVQRIGSKFGDSSSDW